VAIGLAVMIITVSVVLGFKHTIRDKAIGFASHIQVMNILSMNSVETYPICIDDSIIKVISGIEGIKHVQRYALTRGILKTDDDFLGVAFKGIGPEYDLDYLKENLVEGQIPAFSDTVGTNRLLLSRIMADKLKLKAGDRVFAYFIGDEDVRTRRFTVEGIYQTNMTRFDEAICYTDIYTANKLNGWFEGQCSGAELTVKDFDRLDDTYINIINKVNRTQDRYHSIFSSQTVYEAYPQLFTWLELLDINVWIILGLMICLAGITMTSGLLIIILERTSMIGVLKAIGSRNRTIRHTFLWFSAFIISRGLLLGDILGIGLVLLQQYTGLVTLDPQTYYVSEAPVELDIPITILLNVATLIVSISVLIIPSFFISHIHPAKSMRYE
jgi:lipoprotein-releasing system permease protein